MMRMKANENLLGYGLNVAMHMADCIEIKRVLYIGGDVQNVYAQLMFQ